MFGPTGSPAHLINIYKKPLLLLSTSAEARIGTGTALGRGFRHEEQQTHMVRVMVGVTTCWERWQLVSQSPKATPNTPVAGCYRAEGHSGSFGTRQSGIATKPGSEEEQQQM